MSTKLYIAYAEGTDPCRNLAMEEYLLTNCPPDSVTLYLWQNAHTVVIGRNQNPWTECRLQLLQEEGGQLVRRLSGGGAVYHDIGNLNFTFLCREENYDLHKQLSVIQAACRYAGIDASFSGRNDLLAEGKKFSGNAFYHTKGRCYHHGTLLIRSDLDRLNRYLSPPKAKLEAKGIASVRSRVINLSQLAPELTCQTMKDYMAQAFSSVYGAPLSPAAPVDQAAVSALSHKYSSQQWLYGQPFPFSCQLDGQFDWGHLSIQLQVEKGIICHARVYTDSMDPFLSTRLSQALEGCPFRSADMAQRMAFPQIGHELQAFIQSQNI